MLSEFPQLDTRRLRLREIVETDAEALLAIHSDVEHMRWFGADPLETPQDAIGLVRFFARWRQQMTGTRWGIERKEAAGLVGTCGLFAWDPAWKKCSIGFELARHATGQGLMRESLETMIPWGFEVMGLHRIEALTHERNTSSLVLLARLGFVHEGRLRHGAFWGGQHHDMLLLALLADDWRRAHAE